MYVSREERRGTDTSALRRERRKAGGGCYQNIPFHTHKKKKKKKKKKDLDNETVIKERG